MRLPVIGKSYIYKVLPEVYGTIIVYKLDGLNIYTKRDDGFTYTYSPALFWNEFEELPDQEPTPDISKMETTDKVKEALKELKYHIGVNEYYDKELGLKDLKEAAQDLINALEENKDPLVNQDIQETHVSSKEEDIKSLDNSLDGTLDGIVENAVKRCKKLEPKSIWKPISELPHKSQYIYVKTFTGEIDLVRFRHKYFDCKNQIDRPVIESTINGFIWEINKIERNFIEYCTLNDFINHQENLEERITKLENKND